MEKQTCLGDGVYAQLDEAGDVVLTTDSHIRAHAGNVIVLEPEVLEALEKWLIQREQSPFRKLIAELYYCLDVLGKGVGKITTPDGFFARWNEAALKAGALLKVR